MSKVGKKNHPLWRIGVFDARTRRDGKPIEYVGHYDPHQERIEDKVKVNRERVEYWISKGAQPTDTVASLLKKLGPGK
jgi:small subunit ribosomal protein S16